MFDFPKIKFKDNEEMIVIQGGMGVGISGKNLASAVANCGGIGVIATVGLAELRFGLEKVKTYPGGYAKANADALRAEIIDAKEMTKPGGVIATNTMYALDDFPTLVETAVEENIKVNITGAGPARDFPKYFKDENNKHMKDMKLLSIVSSVKAAKLMHRSWEKNGHAPDAFIAEGPMAGGHLGFKYEDLVSGNVPTLETIAKEVIDFAGEIPVIVAGGIYTGADIKKAYEWGAAGVQMATRFVTTLECDADDGFKQAYLDATEEDIQIIKSPVGYPGRAIKSPFLERVMNGEEISFKCGYKCLKTCNQEAYCIADALINARQGNLKNGFAFAGANAPRATPETCLDTNGKFITVNTLFQRLSEEYKAA